MKVFLDSWELQQIWEQRNPEARYEVAARAIVNVAGCEHTCDGPHGPRFSGQFKLKCHEQCPGCHTPIAYGQLNDHLRTCHRTE